MKKRSIFLLFLAYCAIVATQAQSVERFAGRWWLTVLEQARLPLNLTFDSVAADSVVPRLYSPLQSAAPITVSQWQFDNDTLEVHSKSLGIKIVLRWDGGDSTFAGTFRQGLMKCAITMRPSKGMYEVVRPQTPQPPYPYAEEAVTVRRVGANGDTITLAGTLTRPAGGMRCPAVLLVSGSGQQNRDEECFGHKPFFVIADHLARHGIATLRYDDRGTGQSSPVAADATTYDNADDAEALFNALVAADGIDPCRVGIAGHSEGGAIAPMVAARNNDVAFVVMLAGPGTSGREILLNQNQSLFRSRGVADSLIGRRLACLADLFDACLADNGDKPSERYKKIIGRHTADLTKEQCDAIDLHPRDAYVWTQQLEIQWMKTFLTLDPKDYLPQVACPILAIGGDKDFQVPAAANLAAIARLNPAYSETHLLHGLNHLFQHCTSGLSDEYMVIEETFAPEALEAITNFILRH